MTDTHRHPHPALVLGSIGLVMLIWSGNYIASKVALREFDALTLASFRIVLATALLLPVFLLRRQPRAFDRSDAVKFMRLGLFGVVMNQIFFTLGLSLTTVSHSAVLVGLGPIYVLLLVWMQGLESISAGKIAGMSLAFAGVAVLGSEHGFSLKSGTLAGDLLTMCGSFAFSLYIVLGKKVARKYSTVEMNFFNYLTAAVLILPVAFRQASLLDWASISTRAWLALAYIASFASVAAYLIYFWALRHVTASRIAAFSYLLPVLATGAGIMFLGERPTLFLVVGGALVLAGVYLAERAPAGDATADEEQQTV